MKGLRTLRIVFGAIVALGAAWAISRLLVDGPHALYRPQEQAKASVPANPQPLARSCSMILTDDEMRNWQWGTPDDAMRVAKVHAFLKEKGSILAAPEFQYRPAAYIVAAAKEYRIHPLVILVTLQKEQGLIVHSDGRMPNIDFAMGYQKPSTLSEQIADGTAQFDRYLTSPSRYRFRHGVGTKTVDGVMVWPQNDATAALYNYTPWAGKRCGGSESVGGTGLFLQLWESWVTQNP